MVPIHLLFWLLILGVGYTYVLYALVLYLFSKKRASPPPSSTHPSVLHIIAAYNEEEIIERKIRNTLELSYPQDKIQTVIVADGSTDQTVTRAGAYPVIHTLYEPLRKGKIAAINRAVAAFPDAEILVFSDANTLLNKNALQKIVAHYHDPLVGGVAAEKKVMTDAVGLVRGEGLYWRYESFLKRLEADFHTVVGAAGELFSIRKELFQPLPEFAILDDLLLSLDICRKGKVVRYEAAAFAIEEPSLTMGDEQLRKIRIGAGAFQAMELTKDLMNPFVHGKLAFQYLSHRVMRWVFCPLAIPVIFLLNAWIVWKEPAPVFTAVLILQILFYSMAFIGWWGTRVGKKLPHLFHLPYYFLFLNAALWQGYQVFRRKAHTPLWEKSRRQYTHLNGL